MKFLKSLAVAVAAMTVTIAPVAVAQQSGSGAPAASENPRTMGQDPAVTARNQRQLDESRDRGNRRNRRGPSPEQVVATAQALATSANLSCQVSEATLLGKTDAKDDLYEIACTGGTGYLLQSSNPPVSYDCLLLAATADQLKARGEEVPEGSVCNLPANQNSLSVITAYAREAGVPCQIDAGKVVGTASDGSLVYEVGCPGADGYRIEKNAQGWNKIECFVVMASNGACEFTTPEEQLAGFKPMLPGTDIDDCDAQQIRLMGQNDNGRFVEVKCASGEGFVTRVKDNAIAQVYACAVAQRVGGGCTLTPVAAATSEQ